MRIESVAFVSSFARASDCPADGRVEIAVSGRSNVGKSSLLNSLFGRRGLAKVSSTPGKTQLLNFFLVNGAFHLVDLPGYGFARAPVTERNRWSRMMQDYLRHRRQLEGVIQLVDCRHEPSNEDLEMVQWLREERMPFCLVATKSDKLGPTRRREALERLVKELGLPATQPRVAHSSETGEGRGELLAWIAATLAGGSE